MSDYLLSVLLGIVEGLTEFLPVRIGSSPAALSFDSMS